MRETISTAMPRCFDRWCKRFDDIFSHQSQKKEFRHYLGGLLGESERKNLSRIAEDTVDVSDRSLRHFLVRASWDEQDINARRLKVMASYRQTKPSTGFSLIVKEIEIS
jgi:SRSO17 transposase